ncbi:phage tail tape measure protein [Helicobacter sp. 13S00482-2]|uniref:phage tail tape measure protein n=1 Tax=Helicobacter sp. 13S00482-2 TaxID=1476200 RepID=UPI000BA51240|nr:phage tail tape measure protein [Helicobacter sp. 13S00482-2]PAF52958.1 phage tail tape measure protein [Helicobacter sp. 13S00482-2]
MGLKSDLTLNLGAEFSEITKGIRIFSRKIGESLSDSIAKGISNPINKFKGELVKLKVSFSVPAGQFKKVDEMGKRISDATHVKPELDLKRANKQLSNLRGQILGTYSTFISKPVSASIDFNNAINEINRFADLSTKELSILKKDIWSLGKNNGVGINDILKTTELSAQLGVGKEELKSFTQLALNLQVGLKLGVEESVASISKISKAFSLNTKDLSIFSDEVSAMAKATKTSAKAILEVTNSTLAGAKAFGLSAKQTSALSASFLSVGLDSSEASSSINKFFTELNNIDNASEGFKNSLAKMGIDAQQLKEDIQDNPQEAIKNLFNDLNDLDDEERFGVISELFGKKMANNINSAKDGVKAFDRALEATKDSSGALQKAVDRVAGDGFGDLVISLGSAFKHLGASIGDGFVPTLNFFGNWLKTAVEGLSNLLDNHKWLGVSIAISFGIFGIAKGIGLLITSFKTFSTLVFYPFQFQNLWRSLAISDTRFKISTMMANLYNRSLAGIKWGLTGIKNGLANALFSLITFDFGLFKHNTLMKLSSLRTFSFKNALFSLAPSLKQAGGGMLLLGRIIKGVLTGIRIALISTGIGAIFVGLGVILTGVAYLAHRYWKPLKAFFGGFFEGISQALAPMKEAFSNLWTSIKTAFSPLVSLFTKIFGEVNNTQEELGEFAEAGLGFGKVVGTIIGIIAKPFEYVIRLISLIFEGIGKVTSWIASFFDGEDKKLEMNSTKTIKGSLDETLAKQSENRAKMLSSIQSNQTNNSREINDYKNITINTNASPKEIVSAISSYSYDDDNL